MSPWNLLPVRERASPWRRRCVGGSLALSALGGGALAACVLSAQDAQQVQLQAAIVSAQARLASLQQQTAQLHNAQWQSQQTQERLQHVQALRQRAQRVQALHQVAALRWPTGVAVQEWRIEGPWWRLQGRADSGLAVEQLLQALTPHGPWQQAPTLVELATATGTATGTAPAAPLGAGEPMGLRYQAEARWSEAGLAPPTATAAPLTPTTSAASTKTASWPATR